MLVEKYIVIGINDSKPYIMDINKQNSYSENLIDPITVMKDTMNTVYIFFEGKPLNLQFRWMNFNLFFNFNHFRLLIFNIY